MPGRGNWTGPAPDWSKVEWYVYGPDYVAPQYCRVAPRELSAGELRPHGERLLATVRRCSLKTVKMHLANGVEPAAIQGVVDAAASRYADRMKPGPNTYRDLCERLKRGKTADKC